MFRSRPAEWSPPSTTSPRPRAEDGRYGSTGSAPAEDAVFGGGSIKARSGCIQKERIAPKASRQIDPTNGKVQLCVLSMMIPKTSGDTIAARAEPLFIRPLAVPE